MILVFAGAGASKAVNPSQYPTTVEFFERLPEDVKNNELFRRAVEYLRTRKKADPIDIEQILWLVTELRDFMTKAGDNSTVPGWFIEGNRLISAVGGHDDVQGIRNVATRASRTIESLSSTINAFVYDVYGETPSEDELRDNWIFALNQLRPITSTLEIVTTNYDVAIEEAISVTKAPVLTGRTQGTRPVLQLELWDITSIQSQSPKEGKLTKLHGVRGNQDRIHVGTPLFQGRHERHAIIYPGFKGNRQTGL